MRCDIGFRPSLWANIGLARGTTKLIGFEDRLRKELNVLAPEAEITFVMAVDKQLATWVGGSILGELELFSQMVVTREEYDESEVMMEDVLSDGGRSAIYAGASVQGCWRKLVVTIDERSWEGMASRGMVLV
jgi:hypothetical protein